MGLLGQRGQMSQISKASQMGQNGQLDQGFVHVKGLILIRVDLTEI